MPVKMIDAKPDTKEKILASARELFTKNGYSATSVREIAAASGTNVAHIKYYFESKFNLFQIIFGEAFDILMGRLEQVLDADVPFRELIVSWIDTYYEVLAQYPQIPIFILNEINNNPSQLGKKMQERNPTDVIGRLSERVKTEVSRNAIVDIPPLDLALNILSMCVFPFMFGGLVSSIAGLPLEEYHVRLEKHKEYVISFTLNAIRP